MSLSSSSRLCIYYVRVSDKSRPTNTAFRVALWHSSNLESQMLGRVARISLRRGIHTTSSSSPAAYLSRHKLATAVGASIVAASYLGWRMNLESRRIALDSDGARTSHPSFCYLLLIALPQVTPKLTTHDTSVVSSEETQSTSSPGTPDLGHLDEQEEAIPSEEEASSQGAFDPVTGKINWDCPCLGGMAYGPCGMQFREAFSCFVFSEEEPKGIDCVEKFKAMQDCFRENPDVYGDGTHHAYYLVVLCPHRIISKQKL
jgi:intermembrane space import and assembly protein 40